MVKSDPAAAPNIAPIEDVTQRQQAARALAASEVRYRRLFEMTQDAILILDGDTGKIME
jgi:PAS domain-containing protein